jgi:hypothetical protein
MAGDDEYGAGSGERLLGFAGLGGFAFSFVVGEWLDDRVCAVILPGAGAGVVFFAGCEAAAADDCEN